MDQTRERFSRYFRAPAIALVVMAGTGRIFAWQGESSISPVPADRVRSADKAVEEMIVEASLHSATFRRLLQAINRTNGMVYVEPGACNRGVMACLQIWMQAAGGNRFLRVVVDVRKRPCRLETMAAIGHEMQHAIEALSDPSVATSTSLYNFFRRYAPTDSARFETVDAVHAGDAVLDELRHHGIKGC